VRLGRVVPLIGSGLSRPSGVASWDGIVDRLRGSVSEWLGRPIGPEELDLLEAPLLYSHLHDSRQPLYDILDEAVGGGFEPNALHTMLAQMPFQTILTTNWDTLLEDAASQIRPSHVIFDDQGVGGWRESEALQIVKMHGSIASRQSIVFGEDDYSRLYTGDSLILHLFRTIFATRSILLLGFGMRDTYVKALFSHIRRHARGGANPHYVVVANDGSMDLRSEYLRSAGFIVLPVETRASDPYGLSGFLEALHAETYVVASQRLDRTRMIIRETKRLRGYLGPDRTIRLRATMGPFAVPDYRDDLAKQLELFGSAAVFDAEWELRELCIGLAEAGEATIRMIGNPADQEWVVGKGYATDAYLDRLRAFVDVVTGLGDAFEIAPAPRSTDANSWIVSRLALVASTKADPSDQRLYDRSVLEVQPERVRGAVAWFDEEFAALVERVGGAVRARDGMLGASRQMLGTR
jgi:hypothetical protein